MGHKDMVIEVVKYLLDNSSETADDFGFSDIVVQYMVEQSYNVQLDTAFIDSVIQTMDGIDIVRVYQPKEMQ